jgi:hypothetical protein
VPALWSWFFPNTFLSLWLTQSSDAQMNMCTRANQEEMLNTFLRSRQVIWGKLKQIESSNLLTLKSIGLRLIQSPGTHSWSSTLEAEAGWTQIQGYLWDPVSKKMTSLPNHPHQKKIIIRIGGRAMVRQLKSSKSKTKNIFKQWGLDVSLTSLLPTPFLCAAPAKPPCLCTQVCMGFLYSMLNW